MKLNKLIAAASAIAMLGGLSAVPVLATNAQTTLTVTNQISNVTTKATVENTDIASTTNNSSIWYLGTYDLSTIESISANAALCPKDDNNPKLRLGYMTVEEDTSITSDYITTNSNPIRSSSNRIAEYSGRTQDTTATPTQLNSFQNIELNLTSVPEGNSALFIYAEAQDRRVLINTVTITYKPYLNADNQTTLYKGEKVTFTTNLENPTLTFTAPTSATDSTTKDYTDQFTNNGDGSYTYNNNGRLGDSTGAVTVTATSGDKTATTVINTQRLRHISYKIDDASDESPVINVTANVNDSEAYSEYVTYANGLPNNDQEQHKAENKYSGHSQYSMTFTVPAGYKLTLDNKTNCTITETGNTVTITNGSNDLDNDFYVTGTLTKESSTHTSDYFKFDYTADTQRTFRTVTINATRGTETKEASAALNPEITLEERASGIFYMNVTNVPDDVKINSITLN